MDFVREFCETALDNHHPKAYLSAISKKIIHNVVTKLCCETIDRQVRVNDCSESTEKVNKFFLKKSQLIEKFHKK